jgi:hypothetical protein
VYIGGRDRDALSEGVGDRREVERRGTLKA